MLFQTIDFFSGPIVYGCIVLRDVADSIFVSDYNSNNREALRKWILNEKWGTFPFPLILCNFRLPYNFDYISGIVQRTERTSESVEEMQNRTRTKMHAIFDVRTFSFCFTHFSFF